MISKAYSIAVNVMFHATGIALSKHNIAYLSGLCDEVKQLDDIKEQKW